MPILKMLINVLLLIYIDLSVLILVGLQFYFMLSFLFERKITKRRKKRLVLCITPSVYLSSA